MEITDNTRGEQQEEALLEIERMQNASEVEELKDNEEPYNPLFQKPIQEKEGDLKPLSQKQYAQMQTTGIDKFTALKQWRDMPDGPEKDVAKEEWFQQYYRMSSEEFNNSNPLQKFQAEWQNQEPSAVTIPGAMSIGALDIAFDAAGMHPMLGPIDDWWDNTTKFNNPTLKAWRHFGNIVIPTMVGSGAVLNATKGQKLIVQGAATLGVDLAVTGISESQTESESITQTLVETFPNQFGEKGRTPLPQGLVTTDDMSAMNRKLIHMIESTPFALLGNTLGFLFSRGKPKLSWFKPLDKQAKKYKKLAIARTADNQINIRIKEIDQILTTKPNSKDTRILKEERKRLSNLLGANERFDQYVEAREGSKQIQADAAGAEKIKDPNSIGFDPDITPVPDQPTTGFNSIPEGSAARNMAEIAAIKNGNTSTDGLPPPILTENTRRKGLRVSGKESPSRTTIMDIEQQARAMGEFEVISDGIKYSRKSMDKAAEKVFTSIMEAGNVDDVQKIFMSERSIVKFADDVSVQFATEPQARAAFWAIRELFDRYIGGPVARASARYMDTTGREIAATAQAMNEYGSEIVDDIQQTDIILGKLQYLLTEWGINAKVGSAVLKLKDATSTGPGFVKADELVPHMLDQFKAIENGAHAKAVRLTSELRRLAVANPLAIKPLLHAFEYTKGDVDTMVKLMKWAGDKVDIRGLIISPERGQMNFMAKGLWGVFFNNMLSGLAPLNALKGNVSMQVMRPINQAQGALMFGLFDEKGFEDFRKVIFYHSSVKETNRRALTHGWEVMKKVHKDPYSHLDSVRSDLVIKAQESDSILEEIADVWKADNDLGHLAQYEMAKAFHKLYSMPWFRTGMTGIAFSDGMTDIHSATWISRLEAWEDVAQSKAGLFSKEALEQAEKVNYAKKFDKNQILKDGPAKADADEIKFNIRDDLAKTINDVTNTVPPLKHIFTFPKALSNAMKVTLSYQPIAAIPGVTKYGDTIWARTDEEMIAALARHNIDASTTPHWRQIFKVKQYEYIGRLMTSALITRQLWDFALDGGINGPGHYNPSRRQREFKYFGRRPQTIKFPVPGKDNDVLISYKGIPGIETVLDLMGMMAYYARDIEQPLYEDIFRKVTATLFLSLGDSTFFSGIDKIFDIFNGNAAAAKKWLADQPVIPSGVKVLAKAIDSSYKEIYNDFTDYVQAQVPVATMWLPDEINPITGKIMGRHENKIADIVQALLPFKVYDELDNTPSGKVLQKLADLNWEGITKLKKDSTGKIEWTNEEISEQNAITGKREIWKRFAEVLALPKVKYLEGKIRAAQASGENWGRFTFKEDLAEVYDMLDAILKEEQEITELEYLTANPDKALTINGQALMELKIKEGKIDEAIRIKRQTELEVENLLQMAK